MKRFGYEREDRESGTAPVEQCHGFRSGTQVESRLKTSLRAPDGEHTAEVAGPDSGCEGTAAHPQPARGRENGLRMTADDDIDEEALAVSR